MCAGLCGRSLLTAAKLGSADLAHLKCFRFFVVQIDEGTDVDLVLPDGRVNASLNLPSSEFSEPALDLIDSRRGSRRKVDMIVEPAGEPRFDLDCLVGGVVVHNDMNIEHFRNLSIDLFQGFKNSTARRRLYHLPMAPPDETSGAEPLEVT